MPNLLKFTSSSRLFYILIAIIVFVVFITVIWILSSLKQGPEKVNLEFWGVFDERKDFEGVIRKFQSQNQGVKISYRQFTFEDYEKDLLDALAADKGPDIFMIHHTWLAKHKNKLEPQMSGEGFMSASDFKNQFVDVAYDDLVAENKIYALPLYVDTLALYYNKDLFNSAGITRPPANWQEFNEAVKLITRLDGSGNIIRAGAAVGTPRNINRSTDILMALMIQNGTNMTVFSKSVDGEKPGENALQYYTDFANPEKAVYTWNNDQHYSIDAFVENNAAMMFNYSHQIKLINLRAPRLNLGIAPMPQASNLETKNYANYWAVGVSPASKSKAMAWKFLNYLTSREGASQYLSQTLRPSARRDIIDIQRTDSTYGVFAVQALSAKSWVQYDSVAIEVIFADMIDDVNYGKVKIKDALKNAEAKVNVLYRNQ